MKHFTEWKNYAKKGFAMMLCILLVMTGSVVYADAATTISGTVKSSVNLRKGPSTEFGIVTSLSAGDKVVITGKVSTMLQVTATHKGNSYKGYVLNTYVDSPEVPDSMEILDPPFPDQTGNPLVGVTVYVKDSARLHVTASGKSEVTASLSKGDACVIKASGFNWYLVKATHSGKTLEGYVCADYLTEAKPSESAPAANNSTTFKKTGYVNYSYLNVRTKASTASKKKDELYKTQQVTILKELDGWYKIEYVKDSATKTGYVCNDYISVTSKGKLNTKTALYKSASTKSIKLSVLKKGKAVTLIKESKGFVKVKVSINGKTVKGYVKAKYINV